MNERTEVWEGRKGHLRQNQSSLAPTRAVLGRDAGQEKGAKFSQKVSQLNLKPGKTNGKISLENAKGLNTHYDVIIDSLPSALYAYFRELINATGGSDMLSFFHRVLLMIKPS